MPLKYKLNKALLNVNCNADVHYVQNSMRRSYTQYSGYKHVPKFVQVKDLC